MEKNMEENFEKILQRQQELEYLKKQNTGSKIHTIIRKRRFFSLMRKIFLTLSAALFIFIFLALFRLGPFAASGLSTEETDPFGDLPMVQLQRAANDNDFDKVRDIINENDFKPDTFVTAWVFSMLYEHDQDYDQKYEEALELCKDFHESGISYSVLFEDYNLCYKHLERYEEYAEFLIDIAKQLPEKDDYYDDLPDRYRVINCLESVYPKVSEETQKKIDELGVIEAAKQ